MLEVGGVRPSLVFATNQKAVWVDQWGSSSVVHYFYQILFQGLSAEILDIKVWPIRRHPGSINYSLIGWKITTEDSVRKLMALWFQNNPNFKKSENGEFTFCAFHHKMFKNSLVLVQKWFTWQKISFPRFFGENNQF